MIKRLAVLVIAAILSIVASDSQAQATFTAIVDYEYEYEVPITISDDGENSTLGIAGSSSHQTLSPSSASRYQAAYICMDAQALLCLGISTDVVPVYDPSNLIHLQVKLRDRNERRGTDFLKMRWEIDTISGQIRLASANTLCITKMIGGPSKELVLRPCNPSSPSPLSKWVIPFSNTNDSDNSTSQSGALALQSNSNQCMTLIRCVPTSEGRCDPSVDQPYSGDSSSYNAPLLSGSFVKLAKCDYGLSQELQQVRDCAPGCTYVLLLNQLCNPQCQNAACNWDNGRCAVLTDEPTASPVPLKTQSPVIKPTSSPSSSRPSKHPTTTKVPTARPSQVPTVSLATQKPSSITSKPTNKATSTPTPPTLSQRPEDLTLTPTTSPTQNVSLLSGLPADSTSYSSSVPWWAWLVLSLLLVFVLILVGLVVRDRRRRRQQEEDRRRGQQHANRMFSSEKEIIDVELGMNPARPSHIPPASRTSTSSFRHNNQQLADPSGGYFFREAPPPIPSKMDQRPPTVTSVSSRPTMVSFDASSFVEDEEARRKRKEEEQEERAKKMARRSVMKLLDAMTELESAFEVADKMMGDDEIHATEEEAARVQVVVEDSENDSPNNPKRVSGSTPLKKRSPQKHLSQLAKSEEQSLVKELRSRRLEQAIAKVEKAIGTLERKVTHEHMMIIDGNEQSFQSSVGGELDSTMNSDRSGDPKSSSFSYLVSRSSRGATIT